MAILLQALMITGFVATMMLLIEYLNVFTGGRWQRWFLHRGRRQYLLAAALGAIPGCLGAFSAVAMYSHGILSLGAVATAMAASSGDEAFVMLALMPRQMLLLVPLLATIGILTGALVDLLGIRRASTGPLACEELKLHGGEECECFPRGKILAQWRHCSPVRGTLAISLSFFLGGVLFGQLGPREWNWIRGSLLLVSSMALFVVATVPDHFLETHLWNHVVRTHAPKVFLWTLGALLAAGPLISHLRLDHAARHGNWVLLVLACLIGLIPESGPNLIFVMLFAQGEIPFGVLLANSVVQDGHGMLPMLADSRRDFLKIKAINFVAGLLSGALALAFTHQ
jgi:hypothetical protein